MKPKNKLAASLGAFLRGLCDLMILNILWALCCIPVFTIGPACSALSRVSVNLVRDESSSILKEFFLSFLRDFGKAVVLGLIGLFGLAVVVSDFLFAVSLEGAMKVVFLIVAVVVSSFVASYLAYVFPLHAFYVNCLSGHIKNALALASTSPMETLKIWICFAVPVAVFFLLPTVAAAYLGSLYILFGVSAPAYFAAKQQTKVIARFDSAWEAVDEETED